MLFAPPDEEVELRLGPKLGSWDPLFAWEREQVVMVPTDSLILKMLFLLSFLLAAAAAAGGIVWWKHPTPAIFCGVGVLAVCFFGIISLDRAAFKSRRLGVFEQGIRYGADLIRFDELKLLSLGAPKTVGERYLPTLRKMQRSFDKFPEQTAILDRTRKLTITPILNDGTHRVWLGVLGMYSK
ncbi:MAG: hypothetical protein KDA81_15965, partial [Planctomycetaceae bacterium]|nr:hypothetical protein [Planctomycetaceae bacterium]